LKRNADAATGLRCRIPEPMPAASALITMPIYGIYVGAMYSTKTYISFNTSIVFTHIERVSVYISV
jgi:hypothetical protein